MSRFTFGPSLKKNMLDSHIKILLINCKEKERRRWNLSIVMTGHIPLSTRAKGEKRIWEYFCVIEGLAILALFQDCGLNKFPDFVCNDIMFLSLQTSISGNRVVFSYSYDKLIKVVGTKFPFMDKNYLQWWIFWTMNKYGVWFNSCKN